MKLKHIGLALCSIWLTACNNTQDPHTAAIRHTVNELYTSIDSLLQAPTDKPFSGVILLSKGDTSIYRRCFGDANKEEQTPLQVGSQFTIGSISKQITAVIVLRAYEQGKLQLHVPIHTYLPRLSQKWADTVTVHHLLTHMHGIQEQGLDKPLAFSPGTQYQYSQVGYRLLSEIVAAVYGKKYEQVCEELFVQYKLKNTFHPYLQQHKLVTGYVDTGNGKLMAETRTYPYELVPAGGFVSSAVDLTTWNIALHTGKLLHDSTYKLMITPKPGAVRAHPVFGTTYYGYGITASDTNNILQLGNTGLAPGYASLDFYYPKYGISLVILSNVEWNSGDIKKTFRYHGAILDIVRKSGAVTGGLERK